MKFIGILIVLAVIVLLAVVIANAVDKKLNGPKDTRRASWQVTPKTLNSGARLIWITCAGEEDFLYATLTPEADQTSFDLKLYEAEAQAADFNRLRQQGLKELT